MEKASCQKLELSLNRSMMNMTFEKNSSRIWKGFLLACVSLDSKVALGSWAESSIDTKDSGSYNERRPDRHSFTLRNWAPALMQRTPVRRLRLISTLRCWSIVTLNEVWNGRSVAFGSCISCIVSPKRVVTCSVESDLSAAQEDISGFCAYSVGGIYSRIRLPWVATTSTQAD